MKHHSPSGRIEPFTPSEARSRLKEIARVLELKEKNHQEYLARHAAELDALHKERADLQAEVQGPAST